MDNGLRNVLWASIAFLLFLSSNLTIQNIQKTITEAIEQEDPSFHGDAYYGQAINMAAFAILCWVVPSVISIIGPKYSMCIGSSTNIIFILQFLIPNTWGVYILSLLNGFGNALIWAGQGNYLTINSTDRTITRNTGIFTSISNISMILGNVFVMYFFNGKDEIDKTTRCYIILVLAGFGAASLVTFLLLPNIKEQKNTTEKKDPNKVASSIAVLMDAVKLFFTTNMLLLFSSFVYNGVELGFFSGVYSSCIGFTKKFENRKKLVGLSGILIGIGDVFCGVVFGVISDKISKWGRSHVIAIGCFVYLLNCSLIGLNFPNDSTFSDTDSEAVIQSNVYLALFGSFLLGVGDAIYNNTLTSLVATIYAHNSATAFAIMQSCIGFGSIITSIMGQLLGLYYQLAALSVIAVINTICFYRIEKVYKRQELVDK